MNGDHDHVLRPRPRKPVNPQLAELTRQASNVSVTSSNGYLTMPENGTVSGLTRYATPATTATTWAEATRINDG